MLFWLGGLLLNFLLRFHRIRRGGMRLVGLGLVVVVVVVEEELDLEVEVG